MKHEMASIAIEEFVGLKPKLNSSESKKAKAMNKNVAKITHNGYKDALLNKKCLRHSINGINKRTYEINKISLSCFDDKVYILDNGIYVFALRA